MFSGSPTTLVALFFLLLLFTSVSPDCRIATEEECEEHKDFVPGHNLAGEGIDITTLERKGAKILEMSRWERSDGTCTLCQNPMLEGKPLQRLPLVASDWEAKTSCERKVHTTLQDSGMSVVQGSGSDVKNDWKVGLDVNVHPQAQVQVAMEGSHAKLADFSIAKTSRDKYSFASHEVSCSFYSFRIVHHQPLSQHFKHAIKSLPKTYKTTTKLEYHQFIGSYGTHFMKQLHLGGRARDVTAIQVCRAVLDSVTADEIKDCLSIEASASIGSGKAKMDATYKACEELKKKKNFKSNFHQMYNERFTDIVGGKSHMDLLFADGQNTEPFKEWVESLKTMPGLVSYSLEPIHTLLPRGDPKRESLRQAVSAYIRGRALWRNCTQPCPLGTQRSVRDPCSCVCPRDSTTDAMCCSRERGFGKLTVKIQRARNLWGDYFTRTDAFVKVFFQRKEIRTSTIWNNDNPVWQAHFDLGSNQLSEVTNKLQVQVWDEDNRYDDDLLGSCERTLQAGKLHSEICYFSHGHLEFQYHFVCGPHLGGTSCREYVPEMPRHSGALLQYKKDEDSKK